MKRILKMMMKKLLFFFVLAFTAVSCNLDDAPETDEYMLPVESAVVPETFVAGQTASIMVRYRRPTDCHIFNGFYTDSDGYTQTIAIRSLKFNQNNCMDDTESIYEVPLNFVPGLAGTYVFKFWTGNDSNGLPIYLEYETVVE